ncbi:MAG: glycosyltransferase [Flavobacterium sp.]|nr:glycosyltransferase [Flavobacterium sp.]
MINQIKKQTNKGVSFLFSIGIRVKNEIDAIDYFWQSLVKQTYFEFAEITFLDSGSTDGTLEFLIEKDCNVFTIDSSEFNFGTSCNLIMDLTSSKLVYFFSGHVILEDNYLLEKSFKILNERDCSGFFKQIPNPFIGYSVYDSVFLKYKFPERKLEFQIVKKANSFSNAASVINRTHWEQVKFKEVIFGEDEIWASEVLKNNCGIIYLNQLNIMHSHNDSFKDVNKRVAQAAYVKFPLGLNIFNRKLIFLKVFIAIFFNSFKLYQAYQYAKAHSDAYKFNALNNI